MTRKQKKKNKNSKELAEKVYFTTTDPHNRPITLTEKKWKKIRKYHPEVDRPNIVKSTINKPDFILENTRKALIYSVKTDSSLYLNVIAHVEGEYPYKEGGTVVTAHYTHKVLKGEYIWTP
jgi:hypothetical protein